MEQRGSEAVKEADVTFPFYNLELPEHLVFKGHCLQVLGIPVFLPLFLSLFLSVLLDVLVSGPS